MKKYIVSTVTGTKTRLQTIKQYETEYSEDGAWFEGTAVLANSSAEAVRVQAEEDSLDAYRDAGEDRYVVLEVTDLEVYETAEAQIVVKEVT